MLYQWYETQRAFMAPFSEFASASAKLYNHPLSPFVHTPLAQRISAGLDLIHRLAKDYEKPPFGISSATVGGVEVAVQQQTALTKPFCRLLRFKRFTDDPNALEKMKSQPTVLVVAPLSGHHSTLLRDTVRSLLHDHKVFITDWTDARMVPVEAGPFHLDDYVAYVQEFIRHVGPHAHVISVCQPTVPVLAAVSLLASRGETTPLTMTMMGGPIDARKSPTAVNNLAMDKSFQWFENNVIYRVPQNYPGAGRRVYPGFMQYSGFVAMNPDRHVTSHYDYFLDLVRGDEESAESHREFYDEYNAVLDMPAEYYLDTIKKVFQEFALVNGTWVDRRPARAPAGHPPHRAADDRRRTGRHLRRRPDARQRTTCAAAFPPNTASTTTPKAPATTASSRAGAGARWSTRGCATSSPTTTRAARRAARRAAARARQQRPPPQDPPPRRPAGARHDGAVNTHRPPRSTARAPRVDALDAALPQTQCTRCGYPDCRAYAQAMAARRGRHQPLPARWRAGHRAPGRADRPAGASRSTRERGVEGAAAPGGDRRGLVHRLHAVHQGLSGGLHRRRVEADAHRHRRPVHRLRPVRAGVPGGLHQHGRGRPARAPAGTPGARSRPTRRGSATPSTSCASSASGARTTNAWRPRRRPSWPICRASRRSPTRNCWSASAPSSRRRSPGPRPRENPEAACANRPALQPCKP